MVRQLQLDGQGGLAPPDTSTIVLVGVGGTFLLVLATLFLIWRSRRRARATQLGEQLHSTRSALPSSADAAAVPATAAPGRGAGSQVLARSLTDHNDLEVGCPTDSDISSSSTSPQVQECVVAHKKPPSRPSQEPYLHSSLPDRSSQTHERGGQSSHRRRPPPQSPLPLPHQRQQQRQQQQEPQPQPPPPQRQPDASSSAAPPSAKSLAPAALKRHASSSFLRDEEFQYAIPRLDLTRLGLT